MNILFRQARLRMGLTQEELAEIVGTTAVSIWRCERGAIPSWYYQQQVCTSLGCTSEELGWPVTRGSQRQPPDVCLLDPLLLPPPDPLLGRQQTLALLEHQLSLSDGQQGIGLVGLPGSGKTAVIQHLVTTTTLQQRFAGVLWATVGLHGSPRPHLQRWANLLDLGQLPADLSVAQQRLRAALGRRRFLLVLDDLWAVEDALPLLRASGPSCCFVLTCWQSGVAYALCRQVFPLANLTADDAFTFLTTGLRAALVTQQFHALTTLAQGSGGFPLELVLRRQEVRRLARLPSPLLVREALTRLGQHTLVLESHALRHCDANGQGSSFTERLRQGEHSLSAPLQALFRLLASHFLTAPFSEQEVAALLPGRSCQPMLHGLLDAGLLTWSLERHYHFHPLLVAYVHLTSAYAPGGQTSWFPPDGLTPVVSPSFSATERGL